MGNRGAAVAQTPALPDFYDVLGVTQTASVEEIRAAYRKLALQWHPDKHRGDDAETAADRFKDIATAYSIISDTEKRRKYDAGGAAALDATDLEIDIASLGPMGTAFAAMFSKMGFRIKTVVSQQVLSAAYDGAILPSPLHFGDTVSDKVEKQGANWYSLELTQEHLDAGFVISGHSVGGSKFKLLMFESTPEGVNEIVAQEECFKIKKQTVAGLYFLHRRTCDVGPPPSVIDLGGVPEAALFRRLDKLAEREAPAIKPGNLLLAVYGDNWFSKASYTLSAHIMRADTSLAAAAVEAVDSQVLAKRDHLRAFEQSFNKVQAEYIAMNVKCSAEKLALEELLSERDAAYVGLLQVPIDGSASLVASSTPATAASVANKYLGRIWSSKTTT